MHYLNIFLLLICGFTYANQESCNNIDIKEQTASQINKIAEDKLTASLKTELEDQKTTTLNKGYFYFKTGATSGVMQTDPSILFGLGYRSKLFMLPSKYNNQDSNTAFAYDCNIQYSNKEYLRHSSIELYLPKLNILAFLTPSKEKSLFIGSGIFCAAIDPSFVTKNNNNTDHFIFHHGKHFFVGSGMSFIIGRENSIGNKFMNTLQLELNVPIETEETLYDFNPSTLWSINASYLIGY